MTWWAPIFFTHSTVSGREAVAITVNPVSARASCMVIDPTPPAPPITSRAWAEPGTGSSTRRRSNRVSQPVREASGRAAASSSPRVRGACAATRASTACSWALAPRWLLYGGVPGAAGAGGGRGGVGRAGVRGARDRAGGRGRRAGRGGRRRGVGGLAGRGPWRVRGDARIHGLRLGVGSGPVDLA